MCQISLYWALGNLVSSQQTPQQVFVTCYLKVTIIWGNNACCLKATSEDVSWKFYKADAEFSEIFLKAMIL